MVWNSRIVRVLVGLALLACAVIAILPGLTGYTSLDGTVNARFAVLSAPIEGTVLQTPPKVGTPLPAGSTLLGIRNDRVNRAIASSLAAELETIRKRVAALDDQRRQLGRLRVDLDERLKEFQAATLFNLEQEIATIRQRITINDAQRVAANSEFQRRQTLGASGVVAGSQVEQARAAQAVSTGEGMVARMELTRLEKQVEGIRRGTYVGDGRNDVPYSRQRMDEVTIQLADVDARLRENEAREEQIEKQLIEEQDRIKRLEAADITMPFEGVIWRNNVVVGTNVVVGHELIRVLDCRDLFVDILVSEVDSDEIAPGRAAEIRLLGRGEILSGQVISVRGSAAVVEESILAATPPQSRGKSARIRVSVEQSDLEKDYQNFCQVGRSVQVRFATPAFQLRRWVNSLWFSIF
jgi:multidrug resistance efflux pump